MSLERMTFLKAAENRESFFKRIALFYPYLDPRYQSIERAYNIAKDAFREVYRDGGERYFEHLRAVTLILIDWLGIKDHEIIIAALLHDIVEDIPYWTIERVRLEFGKRVALYVSWLTKQDAKEFASKEERDDKYHERLENAPRECIIIKLADRLHNVITLWGCTPEKRARKIRETKLHYLPFARKEIILYQEMVEAIEILEKAA